MPYASLPVTLAVVLAAWSGHEVLLVSSKKLNDGQPTGRLETRSHVGGPGKSKLSMLPRNDLLDPTTSSFFDMCAELGAAETQTQVIDAKSLPSPEGILRSLNRDTAAARADPCNAQVLLRHFHFGAGFGAKINNMITAVINALTQEPPLSLALVVDEGNEFHQGMWLQHFTNGLDIPTCTKPAGGVKSGDIQHETVKRQVYLDQCKYGPIGKHPMESFRMRHALLSKFFELNTNTSKAIKTTLGNLNLGENYIGVHIRHGDKSVEAVSIASAKYAEPVATHAKKYKISTVFVASDDPTAAADLQKALPAMTVKSVPRLQSKKYAWNAVGRDDAANLAFLTDIVGLWKSKIFIGTGTSNLGRMIYHLREEMQKEDGISLDGEWAWW
eukprot:TRINITY_DN4205_c0_g1_i1.p1 TRINITY_DN4205_c0_g1~~TRINITY_DN4205_c0_g1_i1.p1  ORF type:complete len:386 (+),score=68.77 TRINITY_DN4205_c0_g1_i1:167-1324(+)